jgi:hypothetical protein
MTEINEFLKIRLSFLYIPNAIMCITYQNLQKTAETNLVCFIYRTNPHYLAKGNTAILRTVFLYGSLAPSNWTVGFQGKAIDTEMKTIRFRQFTFHHDASLLPRQHFLVRLIMHPKHEIKVPPYKDIPTLFFHCLIQHT